MAALGRKARLGAAQNPGKHLGRFLSVDVGQDRDHHRAIVATDVLCQRDILDSIPTTQSSLVSRKAAKVFSTTRTGFDLRFFFPPDGFGVILFPYRFR
jgi:hypothetical protein